MMELIVWPSGFSAESYDVGSCDEAWQLVRSDWDRLSEYDGWLALYGPDGRLVAERDWSVGDGVDSALWGW